MTLHCAKCTSFVCRGGNRDAGPEFCPMHGDFPAFQELYRNDQVRELATRAALVEAAGYCRWTRLREVVEFSHGMGFQRLGIAHCPDTAPEARRVSEFLCGAGLEAFLPPPSPRCDPEAQSAFFAGQRAELVVVAGMCVGHESLLVRTSRIPVVVLLARDRRLRHNPVAALYTSRSYLQKDLFGHWNREARPSYLGSGDEALKEAAEQSLHMEHEYRPRVAEAMDIAHAMGITHMGLSFCVGFREEARIMTGILEANGFQVSSACCKTGAVPKEDAGIQDSQKVRPGRPEMICNPVAQAELLNREGVQFALVLGQCVGHDAATFRHLEAPAACLVAKDRVLAHNTLAGLP
jgi:uncharacterized metal-binding protein